MQKNIKILRKIPQEKKLPYPAINRESFQFFITCQAGVEALVKREAEKIGLKNFDVQDRIVRGEWTEKNLYELLVQSHFSNRVYIELASAITNDFDSLFELVKNIRGKIFCARELRLSQKQPRSNQPFRTHQAFSRLPKKPL